MYAIDLIGSGGCFGAVKVQFAKPFNSRVCIIAVVTLAI